MEFEGDVAPWRPNGELHVLSIQVCIPLLNLYFDLPLMGSGSS